MAVLGGCEIPLDSLHRGIRVRDRLNMSEVAKELHQVS